VRVGLRLPFGVFETGVETLARAVRRAQEVRLDHLTTGDHVSFRDGTRLAPTMESIYKVPFERFERYSPAGWPEDVAETLGAYAAAGCFDVHVLPVASDIDEAPESVAAVRRLLEGSPASKEATTG